MSIVVQFHEVYFTDILFVNLCSIFILVILTSFIKNGYANDSYKISF